MCVCVQIMEHLAVSGIEQHNVLPPPYPSPPPIHPESGDVHREHEHQHTWRDWTIQCQSNVSLFYVHAWILFGDGVDGITHLRSLIKC